MSNEPTITISVHNMPELAPLPPAVVAELLARIAYASDWMPDKAEREHWPTTIEVWVETHQESDREPSGIEFHELHHLYFPANGHGFYSGDGNNGKWFRVGARWDGAEPSTITRDHFGQLHHWM